MTAQDWGAVVLVAFGVIALIADGIGWLLDRKTERDVDAAVKAHPSGALGVAQDEIAARIAGEQMDDGIGFAYVVCGDCRRAFYQFPYTRADLNRTMLAATEDAMRAHADHRVEGCRVSA